MVVVNSARVFCVVLKGLFSAFICFYSFTLQMAAKIFSQLQMSRGHMPWSLSGRKNHSMWQYKYDIEHLLVVQRPMINPEQKHKSSFFI